MPNDPRRFGQYELLARIGRGGMGETWKARRADLPNAPAVVIKRILPQYADDPGFVESFVNEAHVTASLDHPNIAHVLDFGQVDGEYYFVIEYVDGVTVDALAAGAARRGLPTLPVPVGCYIAIEILKGLQNAHGRVGDDGRPLKIVHRDISPDNLLVGHDGSLKLVDFGVAKARLKGRAETQTGQVKGKWPYFSPEQARGEPLDGRSDLWAMGVVLYRLLCGRLPFDGPWHQALQRITRGEYPPPQALNPRLPAPVIAAIERALEVSPQRRFQTAEHMAIGLRSALEELAPWFDRQAFAEFVSWALESRGEHALTSATGRARFEAWVQEAGSAATAAGPLGPPGTGAQARLTAMTRGPGSERARRPPWLWAGAALFLAGALAASLLTVSVAGSERLAPGGSPRSQALDRASRAHAALETQLPELAAASRERLAELARRAGDPGEAGGDALFIKECEALERQFVQWLAAARSAPLAPGPDAGRLPAAEAPAPVAATPPADAGTSRPVTFPASVDVVNYDGRARQTVTLRPPRHNLLPLLRDLPEQQLIRFPTPTPVLARGGNKTTVTVISEKDRELAIAHNSPPSVPEALVARFVDFRPDARQPAEVEPSSAVVVLASDSPKEFAARVVPITQASGHFLVVRGLLAARRVHIWLPAHDHRLEVLVNCGRATDSLDGSREYTGVDTCAFALVGRVAYGNVDVVIERSD